MLWLKIKTQFTRILGEYSRSCVNCVIRAFLNGCLLCLFHRWFAMRSPDSDSVQYPGCFYLNRINLYLYQSLFCFPFDDTHPENLGYDSDRFVSLPLEPGDYLLAY